MSDEEGRIFLRGLSSEQYGLGERRRRQRAAPRVRRAGTVVDDASVGHSGDSDQSKTWWMLGPGDDPFLTQSIHAHFVELAPGGANRGHGHQNEALFYILEGKGYEIHDGRRYEWEKDDLVIVHNEAVHRHYNASADERALALVIKTKATWMMLGLWQQGRDAVPDATRHGPPLEWSRLWTPGSEQRKKVVKPADTRWEDAPGGRSRVIAGPERTDVRSHSVDVTQWELAPGGATTPHWHMADEIVYCISGEGEGLQWDVEAEITDRYRARVQKEPSRWPFRAGDLLYVPHNTVHTHRNVDATRPLVILEAQNRLFKLLGYDSVVSFPNGLAELGVAEPAVAGRV